MPMTAQYAIFERRHGPVFTICSDFDGSKRRTSLSTVSALHCCKEGTFS
jgi:hypothetical protein